MPAGVNVPVLIGPVPLFYVQNMTISEGYRIERIAGSKYMQAIAPTTKTISIEAMLIGTRTLAAQEGTRSYGADIACAGGCGSFNVQSHRYPSGIRSDNQPGYADHRPALHAECSEARSAGRKHYLAARAALKCHSDHW